MREKHDCPDCKWWFKCKNCGRTDGWYYVGSGDRQEGLMLTTCTDYVMIEGYIPRKADAE